MGTRSLADLGNEKGAQPIYLVSITILRGLRMALFINQDAKLGELEGSGYLFQNKDSIEVSYQGVFFGSEDKAEAMQSLVEHEPVKFTGVLYKKNRSGAIKKSKIEMDVDVTQFREVSMGARALLEGIEES